MTFVAASGIAVTVPGVLIGREWEVENELLQLYGEEFTRKEEE